MIKREVHRYLENEAKMREQIKRSNQIRREELTKRRQNLLDLYIDGKIKEEDYVSREAAIDTELKQINGQLEVSFIMDENMKAGLEKVIDLTANFNDIIQKASPEQQNELLNLLLEDCYLKDYRLVYKIRKPFDLLMNDPTNQSWLDIKPEELSIYQSLAKEIRTIEI